MRRARAAGAPPAARRRGQPIACRRHQSARSRPRRAGSRPWPCRDRWRRRGAWQGLRVAAPCRRRHVPRPCATSLRRSARRRCTSGRRARAPPPVVGRGRRAYPRYSDRNTPAGIPSRDTKPSTSPTSNIETGTAVTSTYESLIARASKPARYSGGELHSIVKPWDAHPVRIALAYPDIYDLGMSNLGLAILYDIVNRRDDALAERVFSPWTDLEALLREHGEPLRSLESRHPVREFDLLGITLQYEVCATNVLNLLDLSGIPLRTADRAAGDTVVLGGGSVALQPGPLEPFFDAFALGEGEEVIEQLVELMREWKAGGGGPRRELHRRLAHIPGVYVPSLYEQRYRADGTLEGTFPVDAAAPARVTRRVMQTLPPPLTKPIVPFMEVVHDRATIEIQRGCTQGCRFCQAGMIYRPTRERSVAEVVRAAGELLDNTGYDELSLMSLSTTDHREIVPMVNALMDAYGDRGLKISIPSTRVDSFSVGVANAVARGKKHTLTLAPEAGSQRLRNTINKLVTEAELLRAAENAFANGWTSVKMYFMVGQPTETDFDVEEIVRIAGAVNRIGRGHIGGRARVRVSTSNFIPKAHTPYQWIGQCDAATLRRRHTILRDGCRRAGIQFSWEEPEKSLLEAVLSRGDRRVADAVESAWRLGAKFDAWSEHHDWSLWARAFAQHGLDPSFYAHRDRDLWEPLPWDHVDSATQKPYLRGEWLKTLNEEITLDCKRDPCNVCGHQGINGECRHKIAELAQMHRDGDDTRHDRLAAERERLRVPVTLV
ncbi:MAG: TIGR03960 family B12-binding radical SAM protein [Dehalococcoidia bacterium]|nr:TIGR03960 family B12-binding radical SAM protein [Dehalococcoidia bacterium]